MITHPDQAAAAADEVARRERADPPPPDTDAWRAIAALLRDGSVATALTWPDLVGVAAGAVDRLFAATAAALDPASPDHRHAGAREARLGRLHSIRRTLERNAWRHGFCLEEAA